MFDLIVIGAGPGGMSAAINAASEGLSTLVLDASSHIGGQSRYSAAIENYMGFPRGITGEQLAHRAGKQVTKFGGEIRLSSPVSSIQLESPHKGVLVGDEWFTTKALIIACGLSWRALDVSGSDRFESDIVYGGDKDRAHHYKGKRIVIVGGGNSAGQAAIKWAQYCEVTITAKYPLEQTMSTYLIERIKERGIKVIIESKLERLDGDTSLRSCSLTREEVPCDAVIPFIGAEPRTGFAMDVCDCDGSGYLTTPKCPGVFVVGDCRAGSVKRIAVAVGEGASAIGGVHQYLATFPKTIAVGA